MIEFPAEPFPPVDADVNRERESRLQLQMSKAEFGIDELQAQTQALQSITLEFQAIISALMSC
jgi:hypothetical protein